MKLKTPIAEDIRGACSCARPRVAQHTELDATRPADSATDVQEGKAESIRAESPGRGDVIAGLTFAQCIPTQVSARAPRLIGERAHRFHFVDANRVGYLEVDGNYVTIHVGDDRYLTRTTLKHLEDVLAPYDFVRIDRAVLVNLQQVDCVERLEGGQFAFHLRCGHRLVSSRERCGAIGRLLRAGVR